MLKLRLNRRGIIEDWIPLIVFLIVMVIIIFFFISYKSGQKLKLQSNFLENKVELDADQILLNYLRSSAKINDKELTFSEWLNFLHYDGILVKESYKFFYYNLDDPSKNIGSDFLWKTKSYFDKISRSYEIRIIGKKEIFKLSNLESGISPDGYSEIYIPNLNNELKIELRIALDILSKK